MDFATARQNMVESQLRTNKVTDQRILDAMREIPRESFVPTGLRNIAYIDESVEVSQGRFIMQPMILARILQISQIDKDDSVLVVGSSTGYMAAVASKLAALVFALESDVELAKQSESLLTKMAMDNIVIENGPLASGWAKQGPFNVILIDGAVDEVPGALIDQLAEGGRLIAVINQNDLVSVATIFKKLNGHVSQTTYFDANVNNLNEFTRESVFVL